MKRTSILAYVAAGAGAALALSALPFLSSSTQAAPRLLPFQGRLTDANGNPVADGAKVVQFKIYDAPTGGTAVWNGEVQKVTVNGGLVSTLLGSKANLSAVDFNNAIYLEITVDANADNQITAADPPLLPRQSILPAVFAVEAQDSRKLAGFDWSTIIVDASNNAINNPTTGFLNGSKLLAGSVGSAQLGSSLTLSGITLTLPATTGASTGVLSLGGNQFLHAFGIENTFVGAKAGNFTMTGSDNTATGYAAFTANTTGIYNSASGMSSLRNNTAGNYNTSSGAGALQANTSGDANSAHGFQALNANTIGGSNTGIGFQALSGNIVGNGNIGIGYQGGNLTNGDNNIVIGNAGVAGESNAIRIGASQSAIYFAGILTNSISGGQNIVVNAQGRLGKAAPRTAVSGSSPNVGTIVYADSSQGASGSRAQAQLDVPNQSITIATGGAPVFVSLTPAGDNSFIGAKILPNELPAIFSIYRGPTRLCSIHLGDSWPGGSVQGLRIPPSAISFLDKPPAGSHTYRLTVEVPGGTAGGWEVNNVSLMAIEF